MAGPFMTADEAAKSFDIPTSDADGHGRGVTLEEGLLIWKSGGRARQRTFTDIVSISLEAWRGEDPSARCDIAFSDGASLAVRAEDLNPKVIMIYRRFVLTFLDQLGPAQRARIAFRHGNRRATRIQMTVAMTFGVVTTFGILVFCVFSNELHQEDYWGFALVLAALGTGLFAWGLRAALKDEQKSFDPEAIPQNALPAEPRRRGA